MNSEIIIVHNEGAQRNIITLLDDLDSVHSVFAVDGSDEVRVIYNDGSEESYYEAEIDVVFLGGEE
jgi:hypothetical protein